MKSLEANKKPVSTRTIVVAAKPLRFGNEVTREHLREVAWPEASLPAGSFAKADEILSGGKRVALAAVEPNEPMLATKMTGPGQRATLSAMLRDGLKAVTIRVNDVDGVGGFVLPGDHVDVVADAPDRQGKRHVRGRAAERARAGDRPDRRRARWKSPRS